MAKLLSKVKNKVEGKHVILLCGWTDALTIGYLCIGYLIRDRAFCDSILGSHQQIKGWSRIYSNGKFYYSNIKIIIAFL